MIRCNTYNGVQRFFPSSIIANLAMLPPSIPRGALKRAKISWTNWIIDVLESANCSPGASLDRVVRYS